VWPPKTAEFIREMKSEIVNPFPFVPEVQPGKIGPIFEIRYYTLKGGTLPDTAKGIALHTGGSKFRVNDLYNPEINVRYGAWYLRHLLDKYGDEQDALAAYNAGQDNVDRWRRAGKGVQFAETRAYVKRVEQLKRIYRQAYGSELGA